MWPVLEKIMLLTDIEIRRISADFRKIKKEIAIVPKSQVFVSFIKYAYLYPVLFVLLCFGTYIVFLEQRNCVQKLSKPNNTVANCLLCFFALKRFYF